MILFAEFNPAGALLMAVMIAAAVMLLMRTRRHYANQRRQAASFEPVPSVSELRRRKVGEAPADMLRWEVQMHDTARELSAQLDTKMSALQALIAEADRAAARLEAALPHVDEPCPSAEETSGPETSAPEPNGLPRRRDEIYTLADYGYESAEIARRVASPIGEVELILSLREQPRT